MVCTCRAEVTHAEVCQSQEPEIRAKKHKRAKKPAKRKDEAVIDENPSGMSGAAAAIGALRFIQEAKRRRVLNVAY